MKRLAAFAITTILLAGCATHVGPKRTTFSAPAAEVLSAKAGPSDLYPDPQFTRRVQFRGDAGKHQEDDLQIWMDSDRASAIFLHE